MIWVIYKKKYLQISNHGLRFLRIRRLPTTRLLPAARQLPARRRHLEPSPSTRIQHPNRNHSHSQLRQRQFLQSRHQLPIIFPHRNWRRSHTQDSWRRVTHSTSTQWQGCNYVLNCRTKSIKRNLPARKLAEPKSNSFLKKRKRNSSNVNKPILNTNSKSFKRPSNSTRLQAGARCLKTWTWNRVNIRTPNRSTGCVRPSLTKGRTSETPIELIPIKKQLSLIISLIKSLILLLSLLSWLFC